jgi:hypothetical protein
MTASRKHDTALDTLSDRVRDVNAEVKPPHPSILPGQARVLSSPAPTRTTSVEATMRLLALQLLAHARQGCELQAICVMLIASSVCPADRPLDSSVETVGCLPQIPQPKPSRGAQRSGSCPACGGVCAAAAAAPAPATAAAADADADGPGSRPASLLLSLPACSQLQSSQQQHWQLLLLLRRRLRLRRGWCCWQPCGRACPAAV